MNVINREFKEVGSGEVYKIVEVYKNIAVGIINGTNHKERIDVNQLINPKFYIPLDGHSIQSSVDFVPHSFNEDKKFNIFSEETVDPTKFFNNTSTLRLFEDQIKAIPEDKIPRNESPVTTSSISRNMIPPSNDSAIIIDDNYNEADEIARKYGFENNSNPNINDSVRAQNEKFSKLMDPEEFPDMPVQQIPQQSSYRDSHNVPSVQHVRVDDPIISMFRNVKRTVDFNLDLKIENKIPRVDFIEMMEESYQVSIIEFLAEEFAEDLLNNPNGLKKMISDKIRSIVYKDNPRKISENNPKSKKKSTPRKTTKKITSNDSGTVS